MLTRVATALSIPGLDLLEEIGQGTQSVVRKAARDGQLYAVKLQRFNSHRMSSAQRFWREAATLARAAHPSLPEIKELGQDNDVAYVVMEYVVGETLAERLGRGRLANAELKRLGMAVAGALAAVHRHGLVHRDIKPQNILFTRDGEPKLIDFGLAERVQEEARTAHVVGTLLYCSPEQAGVLTRPVDGRSDLYSLGATLFEAAVGRPPFESSDPAELVRQHATLSPPALSDLVEGVSPAFSAIVAKLLAKDPDDRFQSAASLAEAFAQLDELDKAMRERGELQLDPARSSLGAHDIPLAGREREVTQLAEALEQARRGRGSIALLQGAPGSGKSRLVREVLRRASASDFLVLSAKGSLGSVVPLSALRGALDDWLRDLARLPAEARLAAEQRIKAAAAEDSALLRQLSSRLAMVLEQPENVSVGPDVQDRFYDATAALLCRLAESFNGLIFVVDDVQWLDEGMLQVLRRLVSRTSTHPLLVLCTARSDPDSAAGAERFKQVVKPERLLEIDPLGQAEITRLIASHLGADEVEPKIVERLAFRAGGNPFAVGEYLRVMLDEGLLKPSWGRWILDGTRLDQLSLPGDVLELVVRRTAELGPEAKRLLTAAALIGGRFRGEIVAAACEVSASAVDAALAEAMQARLIEHVESGTHVFVHDRVREAMLSELPAQEACALHRAIALALDGPTRQSDDIYEIAHHHFQSGYELEPKRVYESNRAAGEAAAAAFAFEPAYRFLTQAETAARAAKLPLDAGFHDLIGNVAAYTARVDVALERFAGALELTRDPLQRARLFLARARIFMATLDSRAARVEIERGFAEVGQELPQANLPALLFSLFKFFWGALLWLLRFPRGSARGSKAERLRLLVQMYSQLYALAYLEFEASVIVQITLRELPIVTRLGPSRELAEWLGSAGVVAAMLRRVKLCERLCKASIALARRLGDPTMLARTHYGYGLARHILGVGAETTGVMRDGLERYGNWLDNFDYTSAATTLAWSLMMKGQTQESLRWIEQAIQRAELATNKSVTDGHTFRCYPGTLLTKLGRATEAARHLEQFEPVLQRAGNAWRIASYCAHRAMFFLEQGELGAALERQFERLDALALRPRLVAMSVRHVYLVKTWARLAQLERCSPAQRDTALEAARSALAELRSCAQNPLLAVQAIVAEAALRRLEGRRVAARRLLTKAHALASGEENLWAYYEVSREQAALLADEGKVQLAKQMAQVALGIAVEQGWTYRVRALRQRFELRGWGQSIIASAGVTTTGSLNATRYLGSLLEVSRAWANAFTPSEQASAALDAMVRILDAERAFLFLLDDKGELKLAAARDAQGRNLSAASGWSMTVVRRVLAGQRPLVLSGTDDGEVLQAVSVVAQDLRSIMAAPVELQEKMLGVVYLDSRVARGLFTEEDVGILSALASHVAFAIEMGRTAQLEARLEGERVERKLADALRSVSTAFNATLKLESVLESLADALTEVVPYERLRVFLRSGSDFELAAVRGSCTGAAAEDDPASEPGFAQCVATGRPVHIAGGEEPSETRARAGPWIGVPLVVRSDTLGVLVLEGSPGQHYGERQADILGLFAAQTATAVQSARLFAELERRAITDPLTGAYNRGQLDVLARQEARRALRKKAPCSIMMVDVDRFKAVNDTFGHQAGDEVLRAVVARMRDSLRTIDLLGRYGGEEFALVLSDLDREGAVGVAERIRGAVANAPVTTPAGEISVTVSIGVACIMPADFGSLDLDQAFEQADAALYQAKRSGRNRVVLFGQDDGAREEMGTQVAPG